MDEIIEGEIDHFLEYGFSESFSRKGQAMEKLMNHSVYHFMLIRSHINPAYANQPFLSQLNLILDRIDFDEDGQLDEDESN